MYTYIHMYTHIHIYIEIYIYIHTHIPIEGSQAAALPAGGFRMLILGCTTVCVYIYIERERCIYIYIERDIDI